MDKQSRQKAKDHIWTSIVSAIWSVHNILMIQAFTSAGHFFTKHTGNNSMLKSAGWFIKWLWLVHIASPDIISPNGIQLFNLRPPNIKYVTYSTKKICFLLFFKYSHYFAIIINAVSNWTWTKCKVKLCPDDGTSREVRGSLKSIGLIVWGARWWTN